MGLIRGQRREHVALGAMAPRRALPGADPHSRGDTRHEVTCSQKVEWVPAARGTAGQQRPEPRPGRGKNQKDQRGSQSRAGQNLLRSDDEPVIPQRAHGTDTFIATPPPTLTAQGVSSLALDRSAPTELGHGPVVFLLAPSRFLSPDSPGSGARPFATAQPVNTASVDFSRSVNTPSRVGRGLVLYSFEGVAMTVGRSKKLCQDL